MGECIVDEQRFHGVRHYTHSTGLDSFVADSSCEMLSHSDSESDREAAATERRQLASLLRIGLNRQRSGLPVVYVHAHACITRA